MTQGTHRPRCDETAAWPLLQAQAEAVLQGFDLRTAFAADAGRFDAFSLNAPHVFADLSKNLIDVRAQELLLQLAQQCGVDQHRDALFAGALVNTTEQRPAMHFLLRRPADETDCPSQPNREKLALAAAEVQATLDAMLAFATAVRADDSLTDIVSLGIGGSDLGPKMAVQALAGYALPGKRFHFVSNVDGDELAAVLPQLQPHSTLFLVTSKTFTTTETLTNARSARRWFTEQGGTDVARYFVAITGNVSEAQAFGIRTCFSMPEWVGGRFSLWSAVGLSLAIAIGDANFRQLLSGAHAMDQHFRHAPLALNLPVRLGLLDVWCRNFLGCSSRNVAPYSSRLRGLPAYLQQLEMESNGKRVDQQGRPVPFATVAVVWGEPGTNGQHAYFQMLHQGSDTIPVEFIAIKRSGHGLQEHHPRLLANALAQAQALMLGRPDAGGHKDFPGNRPSTFLVLDALTPASLGALLALYEHRAFVAGSLWGINSFDQYGVELGKLLASDIEGRMASGDTSGLDGSTAGLLVKLRDK